MSTLRIGSIYAIPLPDGSSMHRFFERIFQMNKTDKQSEEQEAFEIIETAIDDIQVLVRAFDVITEVCAHNEESEIVEEIEVH